MIRDTVRAILKICFGKDLEEEERIVRESEGSTLPVSDPIALANTGALNAAEAALRKRLDPADRTRYADALLFYAFVNEFDDDRLAQAGWSRDRIKRGIADVSARYGIGELLSYLE